MAVTEAVENYLEAILILSHQQPDVHAIDICNHLGFSRPTISVAIRHMQKQGLLLVTDENHIFLTEKGKEVAESVYEKHTIISELLKCLGVSEKIALEDACRIEHDLSEETFECIKKCYIKMKTTSECPCSIK